jgi:hypothetical protein
VHVTRVILYIMRLNPPALPCTAITISLAFSSLTRRKTHIAASRMKSVLAATFALMTASASASVLFALSTEPNGQGIQKSWVVPRWQCHDLAADGIDNQASWAFVEDGLANGCELYE